MMTFIAGNSFGGQSVITCDLSTALYRQSLVAAEKFSALSVSRLSGRAINSHLLWESKDEVAKRGCLMISFAREKGGLGDASRG